MIPLRPESCWTRNRVQSTEGVAPRSGNSSELALGEAQTHATLDRGVSSSSKSVASPPAPSQATAASCKRQRCRSCTSLRAGSPTNRSMSEAGASSRLASPFQSSCDLFAKRDRNIETRAVASIALRLIHRAVGPRQGIRHIPVTDAHG
jgi:hypothetical protein